MNSQNCSDESRSKWEAQEIDKLCTLVDRFANEMKIKLVRKLKAGYRGWDTPSWTVPQVRKALLEHLDKGDPTDIANFAAFMWYKEQENKGAKEEEQPDLPFKDSVKIGVRISPEESGGDAAGRAGEKTGCQD